MSINAMPQRFTSSVHEVENPNPTLLTNFGRSRSVLYESFLPPISLDGLQEGDVVGEIVVEVESPPLIVRKPKNQQKKLQERAEARKSSSSNV